MVRVTVVVGGRSRFSSSLLYLSLLFLWVFGEMTKLTKMNSASEHFKNFCDGTKFRHKIAVLRRNIIRHKICNGK